MKRYFILGIVLAVLGGGGVAYYLGGTPEARRDRALRNAHAYLKESKFREAIIEFKNAVSADPRSVDASFLRAHLQGVHPSHGDRADVVARALAHALDQPNKSAPRRDSRTDPQEVRP